MAASGVRPRVVGEVATVTPAPAAPAKTPPKPQTAAPKAGSVAA
jgi:hypothetical protein